MTTLREFEIGFNGLIRDQKLWCAWDNDTGFVDFCLWRSQPTADDRAIMIGAMMICLTRSRLH